QLSYRTYTAHDRFVETTTFNPGKFTFSQSDYYSDETATLSYTVANSDVQYKGFQMQNIFDAWYNIPAGSNGVDAGNPNRITLNEAFLNAYMDNYGKPSKHANGRRFNVRPVFELKPAKFSIIYDDKKFTVPGF